MTLRIKLESVDDPADPALIEGTTGVEVDTDACRKLTLKEIESVVRLLGMTLKTYWTDKRE